MGFVPAKPRFGNGILHQVPIPSFHRNSLMRMRRLQLSNERRSGTHGHTGTRARRAAKHLAWPTRSPFVLRFQAPSSVSMACEIGAGTGARGDEGTRREMGGDGETKTLVRCRVTHENRLDWLGDTQRTGQVCESTCGFHLALTRTQAGSAPRVSLSSASHGHGYSLSWSEGKRNGPRL